MPKTKTESQPEQQAQTTDITAMSFFRCQDFIREIQARVDPETGELRDEDAIDLLKAHTQSVEKLHGMCNFLKLLEAKLEAIKTRKKEMAESQRRAEAMYDRLAGWLAEWVAEQGKKMHVGEYELRSRKSTSVLLTDGFEDPMFCAVEMKRVVTPDRAKIKEALIAGEEVPGATLVGKQNLTII
jgi:hypothetical protein